eukprot:2852903-Pyramimonas_sp.AAC.1
MVALSAWVRNIRGWRSHNDWGLELAPRANLKKLRSPCADLRQRALLRLRTARGPPAPRDP